MKIAWLLSDKSTIADEDPLKLCSIKSIYIFVAMELIGFGATFAITQTIGMTPSTYKSLTIHSGYWLSNRYIGFDPRPNVHLPSLLHTGGTLRIRRPRR